jgi:PAS domain S-box-containing protein
MALSSVEEAYFFINKNFEILSYNNRAKESIYQYFGIELYEGFDFRKFIAPGTEEDFYKDFSNALKGGQVNTDLIATYPNGEKIWYRITMKPFKDEQENILGVILSSINIDDVKRKEERLTEIAWHQSHKVRKPLSNILGIVNLLRDEKDNLKDPDLIKMLEESAKELDTIIKETIAKTL